MTENYWTQRVSRRGVVRGAALGGVGLAGAALIGCGSDEDADGSPDATSADGATGTGTTAPAEGGSTGDAKRGGTLKMHIAAEPPNFDMHANSTYAVNNAISPVHNMLVQVDPDAEFADNLIPDLGESWEISDDGLTYTFNLVQNAKFHNGQAFTSADVAATFDRIMNPPDGMVSPRGGQFAPVNAIETPDDYTAVFKLDRPMASLLPIIAGGWNVMYSAEDIANGEDFQQHVNGTGPFRLEEYLRGNRVVMVRNEEYHSDTYPYMDGVTVFIVPDNSTALSSFQSGELDIHRNATPPDVESLTASLGDQVIVDGPKPYAGFASVNYGHRDPWQDERVRQALSMSIDVQGAIAVYYQGVGYVGGYMQPGGTWGISQEELETVPGYRAFSEDNLVEARKLLDAAGVAESHDARVLVRKGASYERLGLFLVDQWGKIGVNGTIDVQETAAAYEILNERSFDIAPWGHAFAMDDPDAVFAEFYLQDSPRNYSGVGSQEVDDLFNQQSQELDHETRLDLVHQMEKAALALHGKTVAAWGSKAEAKWPHVKDRIVHTSHYTNQRWERVWLDL